MKRLLSALLSMGILLSGVTVTTTTTQAAQEQLPTDDWEAVREISQMLYDNGLMTGSVGYDSKSKFFYIVKFDINNAKKVEKLFKKKYKKKVVEVKKITTSDKVDVVFFYFE
jgi:hypothetical protein